MEHFQAIHNRLLAELQERKERLRNKYLEELRSQKPIYQELSKLEQENFEEETADFLEILKPVETDEEQ